MTNSGVILAFGLFIGPTEVAPLDDWEIITPPVPGTLEGYLRFFSVLSPFSMRAS